MSQINPKIAAVVSLFCFLFSYAQNTKKIELTIKNQINSAVVEIKKSKFDKALELSKQALINSFEINNDYYIAQSYNTIGVIYDEFSQSERAIEFYEKALYHANSVKNDSLYDYIYGNLGSTYYFSNIDVEKGIEYYKKALFYASKIKDTTQIHFTKLNLASAYFALKNFKEGNNYILEVKKHLFKKEDEEAKLSLYMLQGIYYSNYNNPKLAEDYFFKAEGIAINNKMNTFLINIYENLAEHHQKYKNLSLATDYQKKYKLLHKTTFSDEQVNSINNTATQIELDENKRQLQSIEIQYEKQRKIVKDSKLIVILFLVIFLVLVLLLLTLFKNIRYKKKANLELLAANEALKIAKEKAEEASRLKTQFVSTITHELRTPLYGVVGITNILLDEHKELANSPHLKSLKFSAKYLLSLVNDILQINKIEEKRITLENLIFNLTDEIATIKNALDFIANKNNDQLIVEIDTAIPEFLIGDKLRLSQIIMNLASNALKFTKNGEVSISADLNRIVGTLHYITFKVRDTGIGIAPEDQEKIFDKFVQIERKEEDYQGTGLGLSIVQRLIELFDSEIQLESIENVGTTFTFTIGFEFDEAKSKEIINNIDVDLSSGQVFTILVVEDNKINQMVTRKIIEKSNLRCTVVDDGYAAMVALDREHFDIVLMDINMPLINGFETTRKIRAKGITIPIIALTAFDKQEVTEEAISSGMNDIIVKPFEPLKLYQVISNQIHNKKENVD